MRKSSVIVLAALFSILGVLSIVHDIVAYFAEQPRRLLWVAALAIGTGLVALAMHRLVIPALKRPTVAEWLRPVFLVFVAMIGSAILYVLSVGPVLRLCGASPSAGWRGLPSVVQFVYSPLRQMAQADGRVAGWLDDYIQLWIGVP